MRLEARETLDLRPYPKNNKLHGEQDVALIAASIERFGFNDPIAVDEEGEIIEGHGRWEAAKMLGLERVPVLVLEGLTDRQKRLYRIAHNKIALSSSFDFGRLVEVLRSILGTEFTAQQVGFSEAAADHLFNVVFRPEGELRALSVGLIEPFEIVWETPEQKKRWAEFVKKVAAKFPQMSPAEARSEFIARCGILDGARALTLFPDQETLDVEAV